jgi:hypothetical protein
MKRSTRRRLNGISLAVIGVCVVAIVAAVSGSHNSSGGTPAPKATPVAATASATPSPTPKARKHHHHHHRPAAAPSPTVAATQPAAAPTACYPISDEGTCYEPGEYCRYDDESMTGLAGDGETITCEDNDGWRWEPS